MHTVFTLNVHLIIVRYEAYKIVGYLPSSDYFPIYIYSSAVKTAKNGQKRLLDSIFLSYCIGYYKNTKL